MSFASLALFHGVSSLGPRKVQQAEYTICGMQRRFTDLRRSRGSALHLRSRGNMNKHCKLRGPAAIARALGALLCALAKDRVKEKQEIEEGTQREASSSVAASKGVP